jgi:hypothetical protein
MAECDGIEHQIPAHAQGGDAVNPHQLAHKSLRGGETFGYRRERVEGFQHQA